MKILFVMDRRVNAGSIHAVANHIRAGDDLGHSIALYGREDPAFPDVRCSTDVGAFDYVVFVVESWRQWMSALRMPAILECIPRWRRAIVDADGMYNQTISVDGYDRNHVNEYARAEWLAHYDLITDKILQPTFEPREPRVLGVPFYGYDPAAQLSAAASPPKRLDILHVGHNWWRWREVSTALLPAIEQIRAHLDGICFAGSWWDAAPAGASDPHLRPAFGVDPAWFQRLGIQVRPPVPYTEVVRLMSMGRINIMTQRPLFRRLKFFTSKFFEIFCADTIPLVVLDPDHAAAVYGPAGRDLALHGPQDRIAEKLRDALERPRTYRAIVQEVRCHLAAHHSYRHRVQELVAALRA